MMRVAFDDDFGTTKTRYNPGIRFSNSKETRYETTMVFLSGFHSRREAYLRRW